MMIDGKKIYLRTILQSDAEDTLAIHQDFEGIKSLMGFIQPVNMENEKVWLSSLYPTENRDKIYFGIIEKEGNKFAGYVSAKYINNIDRTCEFGIIIKKEFRGNAYSKEVLQLFFDYLFNQLNIRKINLKVLTDNVFAIALYKKYGFEEEGKLKEQVWQDGYYKDLIVMSLFSEKYKSAVK